jgi:DNA invertase Pin-like site-specific DNA recombinase
MIRRGLVPKTFIVSEPIKVINGTGYVLTPSQRQEIVRRNNQGVTTAQLALCFEVTKKTIYNVIRAAEAKAIVG